MRAESRRDSTIVFAKLFPKTPALVRHPVRCGKPSCRCAGGALHESWRLVWRDALGRQRRRYVRRAEVEAVRAVLARRRERSRRLRQEREAAMAWLRGVSATLREQEREAGR